LGPIPHPQSPIPISKTFESKLNILISFVTCYHKSFTR
jgi:hypothetical protein